MFAAVFCIQSEKITRHFFIAVCPHEIVPPHLAYVSYTTDMSNTGDVAVFECEENYKMISPGYAMCGDDGEWRIVQKVECLRKCKVVCL